MSENLATEKQIKYINNLFKYDKTVKIPVPLSKSKASEIIKHLLDKKAESDTNRRKFNSERNSSSYPYHSVLMWNEAQGGW